ncbi:uncharacterized protein LOC104908175 isoform X1 [Beta vulgaris subsp. vulgaris]|uniref:uncharacterized protein LOC104908175 isoform X1 n=1 Tax=Beta vulgaris subsp. vulgaris TaxID=3555 RepID=UPI002036A227|nr:uncharacterized protein LOC104908175 isoform X1 [Beta vulgaris subsp. vulgaris]
MRGLAAQIYTYICGIRPRNVPSSGNSSLLRTKEELTLEEQAERKIGWLLKLIFAGTATAVGYQLFPYMGDNLIQQSVSLMQAKDPLFKRMGASRIARFAVDDERRMKILEMGGAEELVKMLDNAKDDRTRKEALKALSALSNSGSFIVFVKLIVQRTLWLGRCMTIASFCIGSLLTVLISLLSSARKF